MTYLLTNLFGIKSSFVAIISTAIMTPIIVIFGEILPKIIAKKYSYSYLKKICYTIEILNKIFFPITFPLSKITLQSKITNSESELKSLISIAKKEGVIEENEAELASRALDMDSTKINLLMTKKEDIISIKNTANIGEAKKIFYKTGHSRILVKKKNKYIGIIILKDLLFEEENKPINKYILEAPEVSQYIYASKALEEMRKHKVHLLIVKSKQESKRIVGILTVEDILEVLVGEIYDEHDDNLDIHEIAHDK
jgi:CBS domain containing-hemolysin-like protein